MAVDKLGEYPEETFDRLKARADAERADEQYVTPVYTKTRGLVGVAARVERDGTYWASSVTLLGDQISVDAAGVVVNPDDPHHGYIRLTESASCTYQELAGRHNIGDDYSEYLRRTQRVDNLVMTVDGAPVSQDPFRVPLEGHDEPADGQPIAAHILKTMLQAGAPLPPAVMDACLERLS